MKGSLVAGAGGVDSGGKRTRALVISCCLAWHLSPAKQNRGGTGVSVVGTHCQNYRNGKKCGFTVQASKSIVL